MSPDAVSVSVSVTTRYTEWRRRISAAAHYRDLFGTPDGSVVAWLDAAQKTYRAASRAIHPDVNGGSTESEALFARLSELWGHAQQAAAGGTGPETVTIESADHTYTVGSHVAHDGTADTWLCTDETGRPVLLHAAHADADADLMRAEVDNLTWLRAQATPVDETVTGFLPKPVEHLTFADPGRTGLRPANALLARGELFTAAEVRQAYPGGVHPKDLAWMWRRVLGALDYAHAHGVVHGAVLPHNVLVDPAHGLVLAGWAASVRAASGVVPHVPTVDRAHRDWYPPGVFAKEPAHPGVDLATAARTAIHLLGGNPLAGTFPGSVPAAIRAHLLACAHGDSAHLALRLFDHLIERLWGPREYHEFRMPDRSAFTYRATA